MLAKEETKGSIKLIQQSQRFAQESTVKRMDQKELLHDVFPDPAKYDLHFFKGLLSLKYITVLQNNNYNSFLRPRIMC